MVDLKKSENHPTNYDISTYTQIKRSWHHFSINHPWISCILIYICILCIIEATGLIISYQFNLFFTDVENARYVLSGLAQSQAAIIAIVVTMTLVVIQLSAGSYSHRVVELHKKNPNMWLLLFCYLSGIIFDFFLIQLLNGSNTGTNSNLISQEPFFWGIPLKTFIAVAFYFGIFTFVTLIFFLKNSINLVKSKDLIEILVPKITKEQFLTDDDEILRSLFDIILGSIKNYDEKTVHVALSQFREHHEMIYSSNITDSQKTAIMNKTLIFLNRCGRFAVNNDDDEVTIEILKTYSAVLSVSIQNGLPIKFIEATDSIKDIGMIATQRRLSTVSMTAIYILGELGKQTALKNEEKATNNIIMGFYEIGKIAIEQQFEQQCMAISLSFNSILEISLPKPLSEVNTRILLKSIELGKISAKQGMDYATLWFIQSAHIIAKENFKQQNDISFYFPLMELGKIAVKTQLHNSTFEIIHNLNEIAQVSLERGQKDQLNQIIRFHSDLEIVSISNKNENYSNLIIQQLEKIGIAIVDKRMEESSLNFCFQIRNIGIFCIENREEALTMLQIQTLQKIAEKSIESNFIQTTEHAIHSIRDIGGFALNKGYEFVAFSIVGTLNNLEKKSRDKNMIAISKRSINSIYKIQQIAISNFYEEVVELCMFTLLLKFLTYKQSRNNDLSLHVNDLLLEFKTEDSILFNKMMKKMQRRFCNEDYTTLQQLIFSL